MKQIIAIVRPAAVEKIEHALHALEHFPGLTLVRVSGESRGRAAGHAYAPAAWDIEEHDNALLLVLCSDETALQVVEAIRTAARTSRPGDGVIAVSEVAQVLRIGREEHGDAAT